MAAPMESHLAKLFFKQLSRNAYVNIPPSTVPSKRHMGFIAKLRSLGGLKSELKDTEVVKLEDEKPLKYPVTQEKRGRKCIEELRPYTPPAGVVNKIQLTTQLVYGKEEDWLHIQLTDRVKKFDLLTKLMKDLDHVIPNMDLHEMETVEDVVNFFQTEVRDTSQFEDLAKLNLPKNLHMNLEPTRYDPETDKIYGGVTAFPKRPTIVSSVKYSRKYKSTTAK